MTFPVSRAAPLPDRGGPERAPRLDSAETGRPLPLIAPRSQSGKLLDTLHAKGIIDSHGTLLNPCNQTLPPFSQTQQRALTAILNTPIKIETKDHNKSFRATPLEITQWILSRSTASAPITGVEVIGGLMRFLIVSDPSYLKAALSCLGDPEWIDPLVSKELIEEIKRFPPDYDLRFSAPGAAMEDLKALSGSVVAFLANRLNLEWGAAREGALSNFAAVNQGNNCFTMVTVGDRKSASLDLTFAKTLEADHLYSHDGFRTDILPLFFNETSELHVRGTIQSLIHLLTRTVDFADAAKIAPQRSWPSLMSDYGKGFLVLKPGKEEELIDHAFKNPATPEQTARQLIRFSEAHHRDYLALPALAVHTSIALKERVSPDFLRSLWQALPPPSSLPTSPLSDLWRTLHQGSASFAVCLRDLQLFGMLFLAKEKRGSVCLASKGDSLALQLAFHSNHQSQTLLLPLDLEAVVEHLPYSEGLRDRMEINCTLSEERDASDAVQNDEGIVKAPIPEEFCAADGASQPSESVQVVFIRSLSRFYLEEVNGSRIDIPLPIQNKLKPKLTRLEKQAEQLLKNKELHWKKTGFSLLCLIASLEAGPRYQRAVIKAFPLIFPHFPSASDWALACLDCPAMRDAVRKGSETAQDVIRNRDQWIAAWLRIQACSQSPELLSIGYERWRGQKTPDRETGARFFNAFCEAEPEKSLQILQRLADSRQLSPKDHAGWLCRINPSPPLLLSLADSAGKIEKHQPVSREFQQASTNLLSALLDNRLPEEAFTLFKVLLSRNHLMEKDNDLFPIWLRICRELILTASSPLKGYECWCYAESCPFVKQNGSDCIEVKLLLIEALGRQKAFKSVARLIQSLKKTNFSHQEALSCQDFLIETVMAFTSSPPLKESEMPPVLDIAESLIKNPRNELRDRIAAAASSLLKLLIASPSAKALQGAKRLLNAADTPLLFRESPQTLTSLFLDWLEKNHSQKSAACQRTLTSYLKFASQEEIDEKSACKTAKLLPALLDTLFRPGINLPAPLSESLQRLLPGLVNAASQAEDHQTLASLLFIYDHYSLSFTEDPAVVLPCVRFHLKEDGDCLKADRLMRSFYPRCPAERFPLRLIETLIHRNYPRQGIYWLEYLVSQKGLAVEWIRPLEHLDISDPLICEKFLTLLENTPDTEDFNRAILPQIQRVLNIQTAIPCMTRGCFLLKMKGRYHCNASIEETAKEIVDELLKLPPTGEVLILLSKFLTDSSSFPHAAWLSFYQKIAACKDQSIKEMGWRHFDAMIATDRFQQNRETRALLWMEGLKILTSLKSGKLMRLIENPERFRSEINRTSICSAFYRLLLQEGIEKSSTPDDAKNLIEIRNLSEPFLSLDEKIAIDFSLMERLAETGEKKLIYTAIHHLFEVLNQPLGAESRLIPFICRLGEVLARSNPKELDHYVLRIFGYFNHHPNSLGTLYPFIGFIIAHNVHRSLHLAAKLVEIELEWGKTEHSLEYADLLFKVLLPRLASESDTNLSNFCFVLMSKLIKKGVGSPEDHASIYHDFLITRSAIAMKAAPDQKNDEIKKFLTLFNQISPYLINHPVHLNNAFREAVRISVQLFAQNQDPEAFSTRTAGLFANLFPNQNEEVHPIALRHSPTFETDGAFSLRLIPDFFSFHEALFKKVGSKEAKTLKEQKAQLCRVLEEKLQHPKSIRSLIEKVSPLLKQAHELLQAGNRDKQALLDVVDALSDIKDLEHVVSANIIFGLFDLTNIRHSGRISKENQFYSTERAAKTISSCGKEIGEHLKEFKENLESINRLIDRWQKVGEKIKEANDQSLTLLAAGWLDRITLSRQYQKQLDQLWETFLLAILETDPRRKKINKILLNISFLNLSELIEQKKLTQSGAKRLIDAFFYTPLAQRDQFFYQHLQSSSELAKLANKNGYLPDRSSQDIQSSLHLIQNFPSYKLEPKAKEAHLRMMVYRYCKEPTLYLSHRAVQLMASMQIMHFKAKPGFMLSLYRDILKSTEEKAFSSDEELRAFFSLILSAFLRAIEVSKPDGTSASSKDFSPLGFSTHHKECLELIDLLFHMLAYHHGKLLSRATTAQINGNILDLYEKAFKLAVEKNVFHHRPQHYYSLIEKLAEKLIPKLPNGIEADFFKTPLLRILRCAPLMQTEKALEIRASALNNIVGMIAKSRPRLARELLRAAIDDHLYEGHEEKLTGIFKEIPA